MSVPSQKDSLEMNSDHEFIKTVPSIHNKRDTGQIVTTRRRYKDVLPKLST